jgi:dihydropteroate synthase
MQVYYRPIPITDPACPADALRLAGGWTRFAEAERIARGADTRIVPAADIPEDVLHRLTAPRMPLAGLTMDAPRLMGILNVTPDSFSDGGSHAGPDAAVARAREMVEECADLIDIGGESTRPGAEEVPVAVEIARVRPVIEALASEATGVPISLDTRKAAVGRGGAARGSGYPQRCLGAAVRPRVGRCRGRGRGAADPNAFHRHARNDAGAGGGRRL